jgi:hypothetical protein
MDPRLLFAFQDELQKIANAGVKSMKAGAAPTNANRVTLRKASMRVQKPVVSGKSVSFRKPDLKSKNVGHHTAVADISPVGLSGSGLKIKAPAVTPG